jgi:hypothetical protein
MNQAFPTYSRSAKGGEAGLNAVSTIVNDHFGWIFRRNHNEHDFGIDGHIDLVDENGGVTGQSIAVQIKSGKSYFAVQTPSSYVYYGEKKHLNFYANSPCPVLLIIHNQETNLCFWEHFELAKTECTQDDWKTTIPKANVFNTGAKQSLLTLIGPSIDHTEALTAHWAVNKLLTTFEFVHYAVDRSDIENQNAEPIGVFFDRLQTNETLRRQFQGRVDISLSGYEADRRELWEIPEVKKWFAIADLRVRHWFYFCETSAESHGLVTYLLCQCNTKRIALKKLGGSTTNVTYSTKLMGKLLNKNWPRLNEMTDGLGMTENENKRITYAILDRLCIPHDS